MNCLLILLIVNFSNYLPCRHADQRSRRSLGFLNWPFPDSLYKRFIRERNVQSHDEKRSKPAEFSSDLRSVEGPIGIEQLPAMIASRNVKRYPYSQRDDPAVM